jgi:hypothetical protein
VDKSFNIVIISGGVFALAINLALAASVFQRLAALLN